MSKERTACNVLDLGAIAAKAGPAPDETPDYLRAVARELGVTVDELTSALVAGFGPMGGELFVSCFGGDDPDDPEIWAGRWREVEAGVGLGEK